MIVERAAQLYLRDGCLRSQEDAALRLPLSQLRELTLLSPRSTVTLALLVELSRRNIGVLLCDEAHNPACELVSCAPHSGAAGNALRQSRWRPEDCRRLWKRVVENKLRTQRELLEKQGLPVPPQLARYAGAVLPGDADNREGQAARVYFNALFGGGFIRHTDDAVNAALNYGYAVLRAAATRLLAAHGYNAALGIHHCSAANRFNLSCDLMEPFRPFVDELVYRNREAPWDRAYRGSLISLTQAEVCLNGERMQLAYALEAYLLDVLGAVTDGSRAVREVSFA